MLLRFILSSCERWYIF